MATSERYRDNAAAVYEALGSGTDPDQGQRALLARTLCAHGIEVSGRFFAQAPRPSGLLALEAGSLFGRSCSGTTGGQFVVEWMLTAADSEAAISAGRQSDVLTEAGRKIGAELRGSAARPTLAILLSPTASRLMSARGDEVTPLVMGVPSVNRVGAEASMRVLRSGTTRQSGLVTSVDVAPTILDFFDIPIPKEMTGQPIRVDGTVDLERLHQLHLDQRRIRLPIQLGEVAFVAALAIVGIPILLWLGLGRSLPGWVSSAMRFLALCGAAMAIPLMAGGLLPRLTYAVVVPFVVLSIVALAALSLSSRWPGPVGPFQFLGTLGLAFLLVDAVFGWRGARIPLVGGTMFDGVRFYGLPNVFIALLLASSLFMAVGLEPFRAFLLLLVAGVFAGFPNLGANVGAAITLFVAAGLWWILRTRPAFGWHEVAFVAGTAAVGLAIVLLANRYLPGAPTHITGFVERTGGWRATWDALGRRLGTGVGQIADVPAAVLPLVGLLVVLGLAMAPRGPIRRGLDLAGTMWRQALIAMTVAGIAAFFVNDTGVAAAAPVFLYAMTGIAYPAFLSTGRS